MASQSVLNTSTVKYYTDASGWLSAQGVTYDAPNYGKTVAYGIDNSGNTLWVATRPHSTGADVQYSPDGITWYNGDATFSSNSHSVVFGYNAIGQPLWVLVGYDADGLRCIQYSYNGKHWTPSTTGIPSGSSAITVAYNNKRWIAGGYIPIGLSDSNPIYTSIDGKNWTKINNPLPGIEDFPNPVFNITYGNGLWMLVSLYKAYWSANGINWHVGTGTNTIPYVSYFATDGSGTWLAVGDSGIYRSVGGKSDWIKQTSGVNPNFQGSGVLYDSVKKWIVVGFNGGTNNVYYSGTGESWNTNGPQPLAGSTVSAYMATSIYPPPPVQMLSDYLFYTDVSGNPYYCVPGSSIEDVVNVITIPNNVTMHCIAVGGGGGCNIYGYEAYCAGAGSGGFYYTNIILPGPYLCVIGTGGRLYDTFLLDGNRTVLSNITAQGGKSTSGRLLGGDGGNGGGGGTYGADIYKGGRGGDISGNIGNGGTGGNPSQFSAGGGGANIVWGLPSPNGQNGVGQSAGNGGGGGGIGGVGLYSGGGGGGYLGGNGSSRTGGSVPTGGRGYGGGGASATPEGGLGGGGGGFDPRILYVYAHGVPSDFDWSSSSLNAMITGNGDSTSAFLSGTNAAGDPIIPAAATVIGNPGALFFALTPPTTTTTTLPPTTTTTIYNPRPPPCFVKGTRILTPSGYKSIETLQSGDTVVTASNEHVSIKLYSFTIQNTTTETAPFKISAGALGSNLPKRDLHVSPRHAVKDARGVWQIPKYLAKTNKNVTQYGVGESITYYHIECPNFYKDNLVAEETEVESFKNKQGASGVLYMWSDKIQGWERLPPNKMPTVPKNPTTYMLYTI